MTQVLKAKSILKVLSHNDVGYTGAHQAGILVPKREQILSFFPPLDGNQKNPRYLLIFIDDNNKRWEFSFIYYNNKLFGGTRNEYRLTRMTKYIKSNNLKAGDEVLLAIDEDGTRRVVYKRRVQKGTGKLILSGEWKIIKI